MTDTVAEGLRAGVKTWLDTIAGATLFREPSRKLNDAELPAIIILDGTDEELDEHITGIDQFTAFITTAVAVKNTTSDDARMTAVQNLLGQIRQKMTLANLVAQIGTHVENVRQGDPLEVENLALGANKAAAGMTWEIDYSTAEGDPFTAA